MAIWRTGFIASLVLTATLALSGCDSAEERAERYFQSGLELLEAGDTDRALVEFRNVFRLNGHHREARITYAEVLRERGQTDEAYRHYLLLVEQFPDDARGRTALATMAILGGDGDEAERHGRAAARLAPKAPESAAITAALDYRAARLAQDAEAAARAEAEAAKLAEAAPDDPVARRVLIDARVVASDWSGALAQIDIALTAEPDAMALHEMKLATLSSMGNKAGIGTHLQEMVSRYPDNEAVRNMMIGWYVQAGAIDAAETFLRHLVSVETVGAAAGSAPGEDPDRLREARTVLVQFLHQFRGAEAARDELDRLASEEEDALIWRHMRAGLDFEASRGPEAIAALEAVLREASASDEARDAKVSLARMLNVTGDETAARARIDEVLAEDPGHVDALQMRAVWLISDDRPGDAVATLRAALEQDPRNPATLTLMAEAHLRDGSRELAGERLALALEAAEGRAAEALHYAAFLAEDGRLVLAEGVMVDALRRTPEDIDLIEALGELYLQLEDWPRTEAMIRRLAAIDDLRADGIANYLRVSLLYRQDRVDESLSLLERLIQDGDASLEAAGSVVQQHLRSGDFARAASYLDALLEEKPDNSHLRLLRAGLYAIQGEVARAEEIYRIRLTEAPDDVDATLALYELLRVLDRANEATAALEAGIEASDRAPQLVFMKAGELEAAADFEGAIDLYDELYRADSSSPIFANNLASLLTTRRDDPESLERAFVISRRLRPIALPHFQDTYGWIEHRRGNHEEAVNFLRPAATRLPDNPLVQLHLGLAYAALGRREEARTQIRKALALAGDRSLPVFEEGRQALQKLENAANSKGADGEATGVADPGALR